MDGHKLGGFLALLEEVRVAHGSVFVINNLAAGLSVSADARKRIAEWTRAYNPDARVMIGATIPASAAIMLLTRGVQLLSGRSAPMYFVIARQETVAIIARERTRLQAQRTGNVPKLP